MAVALNSDFAGTDCKLLGETYYARDSTPYWRLRSSPRVPRADGHHFPC